MSDYRQWCNTCGKQMGFGSGCESWCERMKKKTSETVEAKTSELVATIQIQQKELDEARRVTCEVIRTLENLLRIADGPPLEEILDASVLAWWKENESRDNHRIREEAIAKLSPEEIKVLGIK